MISYIDMSEVIFLGTGTSEGVPRVSCLLADPPTCDVCKQAVQPGNKNRRRNTGLIIKHPHPDGRPRVIMVDVGKFFWHSAIEWLAKHKVKVIDAIVITHDHFDAIGGMDDLRDFTRTKGAPIPIYLRQSDYNSLKTMFPYLTNGEPTLYHKLSETDVRKSLEYNSMVARIVPDLNYIIIDPSSPFVVEGLEFTPLPVYHGGDYICLGFRFGKNESVAYISDTNIIPDETREKIIGQNSVDYLILDCLFIEKNFSHLNISEAKDEVRKIRPKKKTLFVGMNHILEHEKTNQELASLLPSEGLDVSLAYDGLSFSVAL
eukprot:Phypoly_transcript_09927.p1 GENE.Phypoly_transcript_09927~~Phypoly_transcript_09927.p1  ORF type:complete len:317 (+),score=34.87 Phypoly_transcript_09927:388-1338(+)